MGGDDGPISQLVALATIAEESARTNHRRQEAAARFELGRGLFLLEHGDAAFGELRRAADLFQKEGIPQLAAQALLGCAHALTIQNRYEESLQWFDAAIERFKRCGDTPGEVEASTGWLEASQSLQRWGEVERSRKIIVDTEGSTDPQLRMCRLAALRYQVMGRVAQQDFAGAVGKAKQAADLASQLHDRGAEANLRLALALNLRLVNRGREAAEEYERVVALARSVHAADLEVQALEGLEAVSRG